MIRQLTVFGLVKCRVQDDADGPGISGAVSQTSATAIDRASVHTCAAPDAFQGMPKLLHAKPAAAPVVRQHDMHFAIFSGALKMAGIFGSRIPQRTTGQD